MATCDLHSAWGVVALFSEVTQHQYPIYWHAGAFYPPTHHATTLYTLVSHTLRRERKCCSRWVWLARRVKPTQAKLRFAEALFDFSFKDRYGGTQQELVVRKFDWKGFKTYKNYQVAVRNPNDRMAQFAEKLRKYEENAQGLELPGKYAGFVAGAEDAFIEAV